MNKSQTNFEADLQLSPKLVIAGLIFFGLMLIFASDYMAVQPDTYKVSRLGLLVLTMCWAAWLLSDRQPKIAAWLIIVAVTVLVFVGITWLESPVFLSLLAMPAAIAAILGSPRTAITTAVGASAFVFLLPLYTDTGSIIITLLAIWAMVGVILAIYQPLHEITYWSWIRFKQGQDLLDEARNRKAELHQALDDLAQAYRELTLLNERVTAMRLVAEEAQLAKTAFVAKVSHEFRTPLNMIIGLTDVLMDTPHVYGDSLSPALLEDLKIVHHNCEHLSEMVNDILDLSQTEMGRLTLHKEYVDLAAEIEAALTVVRPLLEKKGLALQVNIPPNLPQIYCDRTRIRQVILNLASNAARFTDQGGITACARQQDQHIIVSISDTGPGIAPEDAQRIFEPFFQGGNNLWRDQKGSGLGLSICKQFVELHGGQMWLESEPGVGSTFSFQLSLSPPGSPLVTPARWINRDWIWRQRTSESKIPYLPNKQRILICDDADDLYDLLANHFDEVEFVKTNNLAEAIQQAQTVPAHAVVINATASHNPEPLIKQIAMDLPDTPIIVGAFPSPSKRTFEAGATNYLVKPISRDDLEKAIKSLGKPVKRILIADDDPDLQQLLKRMLLLYDDELTITTALNGEDTLAQLYNHTPDLMLIDITMSGLDGWQILKQKKQDISIKDIPAIIISAQDPYQQPITSQSLLATIGPGISVDKFLRCSLELSALLLEPN
jgi:signal transduction histidine kinase/CheY-like chemotaxis protein